MNPAQPLYHHRPSPRLPKLNETGQICPDGIGASLFGVAELNSVTLSLPEAPKRPTVTSASGGSAIRTQRRAASCRANVSPSQTSGAEQPVLRFWPGRTSVCQQQ